MTELRRQFEALGFANVETFIASGNVVFDDDRADARALEERIEAQVARAFGFDSDTFVRSLDELRSLASAKAIVDAEKAGFSVHAVFVRQRIGRDAQASLRALESDDDRFLVRDREVVWFRRGRLSDSPIGDRQLGIALGSRVNTMRNMNTVRRMVARFGGDHGARTPGSRKR